ncbi:MULTISPECIES: FMN-dependent NADH-azoreductase [Paraburkholderia]|uniref:FMN dependent NADH:quinone oxidoreductase n=1 Tax=Paraburkholderia megapolitana TaxID=420953 RepID=A0A1I3Q9X6_9BURK|nr:MULTISPECIES: NAD(P)H-dependent oxidoreductase [Paraburkholderia]MCX4163029.1 NAD(P)H-dependent oxidoreductase [Paraburkholderia megapolitana]MDN7158525.1 NAD(P)H-dependent oxidoreductase [Paraburkholderia sp. CHISQ3]MDQ6495572.1 NAD(P)H-dependent oxidoreductase [Paraburkholderia megapolitana]QDQ81151.1 FMN-dependent NADH-azoreductase [Paraburkholderia megapolitana]SFJ30167.1 FMN-dependent NADH-azoreductase [Paraburkholderia megapolitana]
MSKLLHLDTSIQTSNSVSRRLSAAIVDKLKNADEDLDITYRDLAAHPLPHLTEPVFAVHVQSADASGLDAEQRDDVAESASVLAEFQAADTIVIGLAFYNYSIPSSLKVWIDRVVVAGKTFSFGSGAGPVGLAAGKRVIVAIARGGVYAEGSPSAHREHAETYLRHIFALIGINDLEVIVAEGLVFGPEASAASEQMAMNRIDALPAMVI